MNLPFAIRWWIAACERMPGWQFSTRRSLITLLSRIEPVVKDLLRAAKAGFTVEKAPAAIRKPTWQWDGYFQKR
jgi:hypothetical protein